MKPFPKISDQAIEKFIDFLEPNYDPKFEIVYEWMSIFNPHLCNLVDQAINDDEFTTHPLATRRYALMVYGLLFTQFSFEGEELPKVSEDTLGSITGEFVCIDPAEATSTYLNMMKEYNVLNPFTMQFLCGSFDCKLPEFDLGIEFDQDQDCPEFSHTVYLGAVIFHTLKKQYESDNDLI